MCSRLASEEFSYFLIRSLRSLIHPINWIHFYLIKLRIIHLLSPYPPRWSTTSTKTLLLTSILSLQSHQRLTLASSLNWLMHVWPYCIFVVVDVSLDCIFLTNFKIMHGLEFRRHNLNNTKLQTIILHETLSSFSFCLI